MVEPPLRLRRLVRSRARHAHERGLLHGAAARGVRRRRGGRSRRMSRLPEQRGERIERDSELTFTFDGKNVAALEGDTIGSALFASGQRTFSRSFKYHRPRGLLCCAGQCPNCLVQVDGAPGVRACTEPVREGMKVEHMNASPSLDFDVMRTTDFLGGPFTPPGFYYKTFIRPRRFWPLYEKVLRHAAGLGKLRKSQPEREWRTEYRRRHADMLVIGGGAAGLNAAAAAAELGADVVLADEGPEPGGRLLAEGGVEYARELVERARAAGVEILDNAPALGTFDGLVPVWQGDTLHQVRAKHQIHATGAIEQPLLFPGNDLPGVMLSGGARRLIAMYALQPGARAVVATVDDRGLHAALALIDAGVEIVCVADLRENGSAGPKGALKRLGVEVLNGATVLEATGRGHVSSVVVGPPGSRAAERSFGVRPPGGVRRQCARHVTVCAGRRHHRVQRGARGLRCRLHARARSRGRRARGHCGPRVGRAFGKRSRCRCCPRARIRRRRLARPRGYRSRPCRTTGGLGIDRRRAAAGHERARRQVLRLPLRGRDREGHPPLRRGGLRLDRALQALHDHDDGPVPGPHVPAARGAADGEGDRHEHGRRGHHDRAPALARGADGRARRAALRAGEALLDPRAPPRARRQRDVGGRLAPRLRLRRPEGRGAWPCTRPPV